ncbi:MAG TPA: alkaline phosphatase D family protein [Acidobacteriota bacterium]
MPPIRTILLVLGLAVSAAAQDHQVLGPVLGAPEPDAVRIWMRVPPADGGEFSVLLRSGHGGLQRSAWIRTDPGRDHTAVARIDGLEPDTEYRYRVRLRGFADSDEATEQWHPIRTAPRPSAPARLRLAFGSCANRPGDQPVWDAIRAQTPDLFLSLGDLPYADTREPALLFARYRESRGDPRYLALAREVPTLAIWDDHDFGGNDMDGRVPGKEIALHAFRSYWPNPGSGGAEPNPRPGVWDTFRWGPIEIFLLDDQSFRNVPRKGVDLLGEQQRRWLERELTASNATIKLIASGGAFHDRPVAWRFLGLFPIVRRDTWWSYQDRDWLFGLLARHSITGVVLLAGDLHRHEVHRLDWKGGYPLYELISSPLRQNLRACVASAGSRQWCASKEGFALLDIEDSVTYSYWDSHGRRLHKPTTLHPFP